ncbi:tRNA lysidine(34) synthetase TilS [soil metagenome]
MALLHLAADWARRRGRRVLAVTVDHGLNLESPRWSEICRRACAALGVDWIERRWECDKPATGLTAAARAARHALIAEAAREAGARVVLLAHTADDIAESDWMRAQPMGEGGATLGRLREWSPSPAWPQGRGLMLLRPLLDERREALRVWLAARGGDWIEDPANRDERFGRSRARAALVGLAPPSDPEERAVPAGVWHGHWWGGLELARPMPMPLLAFALLAAAGTATPPRGKRLAAMHDRLQASGRSVVATLAGARVLTLREAAMIGREAGEMQRTGQGPVPLTPNTPTVWDGRFEITAGDPGWNVVSQSLAVRRLEGEDSGIFHGTAPSFGGSLPVLIRDDGTAPVLAWRHAEVRTLAPRRLDLALSALGMGETTQESHLFRPVHGEMPPTDLFSRSDHEPARVSKRRRGTENQNEPA